MKTIFRTILIAISVLCMTSCDAQVQNTNQNKNATPESWAEQRFKRDAWVNEEWIMRNVRITLDPNGATEETIIADKAVVHHDKGGLRLIAMIKSENRIIYVQNKDFSITTNER